MTNGEHDISVRRVDPDAPARDPFLRRTVATVLIVALVGVALAIAVLGVHILLAAFGGILLGVLLRAFTLPVARHTPLSDRWAYALVLLVLIGSIAGGGLLLAPRVAGQLEEAAAELPRVAAEAEAWLQQTGWGEWVLERVRGGEGADGGAEGAGAGVGAVLGTLSQWSTYFLTALFVGLFAAGNPKLYQDGVVHLFPLRHRHRVREILGELGYTLRWWLIGQGIAMLVIGVSTAVMLWLFGVPLAGVIGVIVGLLGFIPYLGPIVGVLPVGLAAAAQGADTALYVLGAYTLVQLLEGYVAQPLIQHRTVYLPPVMTIVVQMTFGAVFGVLGIILATPVAAVLLVLSRFYRRDVLGDPDAREDDEE